MPPPVGVTSRGGHVFQSPPRRLTPALRPPLPPLARHLQSVTPDDARLPLPRAGNVALATGTRQRGDALWTRRRSGPARQHQVRALVAATPRWSGSTKRCTTSSRPTTTRVAACARSRPWVRRLEAAGQADQLADDQAAAQRRQPHQHRRQRAALVVTQAHQFFLLFAASGLPDGEGIASFRLVSDAAASPKIRKNYVFNLVSRLRQELAKRFVNPLVETVRSKRTRNCGS